MVPRAPLAAGGVAGKCQGLEADASTSAISKSMGEGRQLEGLVVLY